MENINNGKNLDKVMESYKKVRESLAGLFEIININLPEREFFYMAATDNLKAINDNVVNLLHQTFPPREIRMRMRELEFDEREAETDFPL